mgnify:CR=1 FL=1
MIFIKLDPQEAAMRNCTHVAQFPYTDLTDTAGTAKTTAIVSALAAGTRIA